MLCYFSLFSIKIGGKYHLSEFMRYCCRFVVKQFYSNNFSIIQLLFKFLQNFWWQHLNLSNFRTWCAYRARSLCRKSLPFKRMSYSEVSLLGKFLHGVLNFCSAARVFVSFSWILSRRSSGGTCIWWIENLISSNNKQSSCKSYCCFTGVTAYKTKL